MDPAAPPPPAAARARRRAVGLAVLWLVTAVVAVAVGVFAVTSVGDSLRERGPVGADAAAYVRSADRVEGEARVDPDDPVVTRELTGVYGVLVVRCQGPYASGIELRPASGWRVVSLEPGPDDDVDAVASTGDRSVSLEVYCDQGRPVLGDRDLRTLAEPATPTPDAP